MNRHVVMRSVARTTALLVGLLVLTSWTAGAQGGGPPGPTGGPPGAAGESAVYEVPASKTVEGNLVTADKRVQVRGKVNGSVFATRGEVHLYGGSEVTGDVIVSDGKLQREADAKVGGSVMVIPAGAEAPVAPGPAVPPPPLTPPAPPTPPSPALVSPTPIAPPPEVPVSPTPAPPPTHITEIVRYGQPVKVETNQVVDGDVVSFGGPVTIEGEVHGDVSCFGGPVKVKGTVNGDVVSTGGPLELEDGAVVQGDAMAIGGPLSRGANTIVRGNSSSVGGPFGSLPWGLLGIGPGSRAPRDEHTRPLPMWASLARGVGWLFGTLTLLLLAGLVALVLPRATNVVATTIEEQPLRVAFYGVVGWLLLLPILFVLVVLVVTWIFIPLLALALALLLLVGCVGTCLYGGRRLAHLFNWRVSSLVALTALGLVALRVAGLASFLPLGEYLVGLLSIAVLVMSLGAALMTRFGTDPTGTWIGRKANHNHRHGTHANPAPPTRPAAETPPPPRQEHDFDDATLEALSQLPEDGG